MAGHTLIVEHLQQATRRSVCVLYITQEYTRQATMSTSKVGDGVPAGPTAQARGAASINASERKQMLEIYEQQSRVRVAFQQQREGAAIQTHISRERSQVAANEVLR